MRKRACSIYEQTWPFREKVLTPVIVLLEVSDNFYSVNAIYWKRHGEAYVMDSIRLAVLSDGDLNLAWKKRSHIIYPLMYLGYPLTFALDILTSPVQIIYYLIGGGAK